MAKIPAEIQKVFNIFMENLEDLSPEDKEFFRKQIFAVYEDDFLLQMADFIKGRLSEIQKFWDAFRASDNGPIHLNKMVGSQLCLMELNPDDISQVKVYDHLKINFNSVDETVSINLLSFESVFRDFLKVYNTEKEDEKAKLKYTQKWIEHCEVMPTARAFTRYIDYFAGEKSSVPRDFATAFEVTQKPLEGFFAETPEDFLTMYKDGPNSCMSSYTGGENQHWKPLTDHGWTPTSFYAFVEGVRGFYVKKGDSVRARAMLFDFKQKDGSVKTYYGRVYATPDIQQKFINEMNRRGWAPCSTMYSPPHAPFRISGIKYGSQYMCPFPYMDNMNISYFWVKWLNDTKEFEFIYTPTQPKDYFAAVRRSGHIRSSDYITLDCTYCGNKIQRGHAISEHEGDRTYCSEKHALEDGLVKIVQGNGNTLFAEDDDELIPVTGVTSMYKFSTLRAAIENGYGITMDELGIILEDNDYRVSQQSNGAQDEMGNPYTWYDNSGIANHVIGSRSVGIIKIPVTIKKQKNVEWTDEHQLVQYV